MPGAHKANIMKGTFKYHGDILSQVDQSVLDVSSIYKKVHQEHFDPAWVTNDSSYLKNTGTMRRATSFEQIQRRRIPRIKLPPVSNSDLEKINKRNKMAINRFAQAYADKGHLYKTLLSSSLPDIPSVTKPQGKPYKFEKLTYNKRIQDGVQPAPSSNRHAAPVSKYFKLPPLIHQDNQMTTNSNKRIKAATVSRKSNDKNSADTDVFQIINTMNRTVEYYEHDGHVYVSDNNQSWKDDCLCHLCKRNKKEYFDSKRKIEERRLRRVKNSMIMRDQHTSPVKELKED